MTRRTTTTPSTAQAVIQVKFDAILDRINRLEADLATRYATNDLYNQIRVELEAMKNTTVTQDQFWPIKTSVYGAIGLILTAAVVSVGALIYRSGA